MAKTVSRFREKPIKDIAAIAPNNEIGMVTNGTRAVRKEPINATTTMPTNSTVSIKVIKISLSASRM